MPYHVPPPFPPDPNWRPSPQFISTEGFGVVPNYDPNPLPPEPNAPPPEPFGPPDLIGDLEAELTALDDRCTAAVWARSHELAPTRLLVRLQTIIETLAALCAAASWPPHCRVPLEPAPPAGISHALVDLRHAVAAALGVVRHLRRDREWLGRFPQFIEERAARRTQTYPPSSEP